METNVKGQLVKWYFENAKSLVKTPRAFKCFYNTNNAPARNSILYIVKRMIMNGCVGIKPCSTRYKAVRTPENNGKVKKKPEDSPRRLEKETGINRCTVRRILNDDLGVFSYKIQMKQHNITSNKKDRVQLATYLSREIEHKIVKITDIENFWPPYFPTLTHVISSSGGT